MAAGAFLSDVRTLRERARGGISSKARLHLGTKQTFKQS